MPGVTPQGFDIKTFEQIVNDINDELRTRFGASFKLDESSVAAQIRDPLAREIADLWEAIFEVVNTHSRDAAEGFFLDELVALIGLTRLGATASTVAVDLVGNAGALIPAGTQFRVAGTEDVFALDADVTLDGSGLGSGTATAVVTGPVQALAGTLTEIVVPVAGLTSVNNPLDAVLGRNEETDAELRQRASLSQTVTGAGTINAINSRIGNVPGVSAAFAVENDTSFTDADGRPPHSIEIVAEGGDEDVIAQAIFDVKPAGIETVSTSTTPVVKTVQDSQGFSHTIRFSRPSSVDIYIKAEIQLNPEKPTTADPAGDVAAALLSLGQSLGIGEDVIAQRFLAEAYTVPGLANVDMAIDTSPIPSLPGPFTNITINAVERASFDALNIDVTVVP